MPGTKLLNKLRGILPELWSIYFRCVQESRSEEPYVNERIAIDNFGRKLEN